MLPTKLSELNKNNKVLIFLFLLFFIFPKASISNEPVDIWNKTNDVKIEKKENLPNQTIKENKINFSKIKNKEIDEIEVTEDDQEKNAEIKLVGLYDPQENDFNLDMWVNTDGENIKNTFKRIDKIKLSSFSEKIFINTMMTYSFAPKNKLSENEFLKLKLNWLIKNNKNDVIENFLNNNLEFNGKSKLIKHLVDYYISLGNISEGCKKSTFISKEIKDSYLEKFRIYCLVLNKKNEEAILNFDLLREQGRSDKFFDNKILFLLGIENKSSNKISDKLEDPEIIKKYEIAASQGNFDKEKIFEIYLSVPFNIGQLINANTVYQSLEGYESRALIYQKILLSDNLKNKLDLLFLLEKLFKKDGLQDIYSEFLSNNLKEISSEDIPEEYLKIVEKNIIIEKSDELGKIKYDDKILHRSKVLKVFTEQEANKDKINKDLDKIYKKIKKNRKYFFSIKDVILLESLSSDGIKLPKDLNIEELSKNLTVPSNINSLVDNGEIGMLMFKLVEIIGSDDIENLDPETLYFIINVLNKAQIKKVRNQILNLTLPLRV